MGNCSGKCDSCGDKPQVVNISRGAMRSDMRHGDSLLHPPKKNQRRLESLDGVCEHYPFGKVPKSHCMNCIREWVNTVSIEDAEGLILVFESGGKKIAAGRIREAIKERKWNERHIR